MTARRVGAAVFCAVMSVGSIASATCFDGVRNGPESDVDCGGDCPACERGDRCNSPRDCYSGRGAGGKCGGRSSGNGGEIPPGHGRATSDRDGGAPALTT